MASLILITACSRPRSWYEPLVGKCLIAERRDACGYWAREPDGFLNLIPTADAKEMP